MTINEAVKCLIEEASQIFVVKPWLIKENPKILKEFGYDDEVLRNPEDSLEVIRANRMTINYNYKPDLGAQLKRSA